jgi:hypothetical protein
MSGKLRRRVMRLLVSMVLSLVIVLGELVGFRQAKEIRGSDHEAGTVEAIDTKARVLTLRDAKGELFDVDVPASVEALRALKVGDKITVTYYVQRDRALEAARRSPREHL